MPKVGWTSVGGATNQPATSSGLDTQLLLSVEVAGAVAPGAHIMVYFTTNTRDGFLSAVESAIADELNQPSVIAICWGSPENSWTPEMMTKFDLAFQAASARRITVVCAAGENGVTDGVIDGKAHVDFPASSPWVLAVGGTRLTASDGEVVSEVVWNDGGSGTGVYREIGPAGVLRSITEGNNSSKGVRGYPAGPGWNACAGWGTPNGMKLLEALRPFAEGR